MISNESDYSKPHYSCWFCEQDIAAGVIPYFGALGKPMCHACRLEIDGEFARQQARWEQQDLQDARAMELVRAGRPNFHDN